MTFSAADSPAEPNRADGPLADLHTHTTASDGLLSPSELVTEAIAAGLAAIAVTDHDTVDGVAEATEAAGPDLRVVPGIELSATVGGTEAHILGYLVDPTSGPLLAMLADFRRQREDRMRRFAVRLTALGLPVSYGEIVAESGDGSVGRPHLARVMVRRGYVADVADAFDCFLSPGCPGFVPKDEVSPEICIDLIRQAGGIAVLAHPLSTGDAAGFARRLKADGLMGLEVEYGIYGETQRAGLRAIAAQNSLVATGGSDYHGPSHRTNARLGDGGVAMETLAELARVAGQ